MMKVRGQLLDVNYLEELESYRDRLYRANERGNKLLACSPFRDETRPSFAVSLDTGVWIDSGSTDDRLKKGNFTSLLSYFMNVSYEEAEDFLLEKYGAILEDVESLKLDLSLTIAPTPQKVYTTEELKNYKFRSPYLGGRGISEKVQRAFRVGYDRDFKAITLPWIDIKGNVVNIKFRSVLDKRFWYISGGQPLKYHVYGLYWAIKGNYSEAVVVESEIDALYLWSHGVPSIAFGGANITDKQYRLIRNSSLESLIIGTDNDNAGRKFRAQLLERFGGIMTLKDLVIPTQYKDVNEVPQQELQSVIDKVKRINTISLGLSFRA